MVSDQNKWVEYRICGERTVGDTWQGQWKLLRDGEIGSSVRNEASDLTKRNESVWIETRTLAVIDRGHRVIK